MSGQKSIKLQGPCAYLFGSGNTGSWRLERPQIRWDDCVKCRTCERVCPCDVITVYKEQKECIQIQWDYCKGCGVCANECPKHCIEMIPERRG